MSAYIKTRRKGRFGAKVPHVCHSNMIGACSWCINSWPSQIELHMSMLTCIISWDSLLPKLNREKCWYLTKWPTVECHILGQDDKTVCQQLGQQRVLHLLQPWDELIARKNTALHLSHCPRIRHSTVYDGFCFMLLKRSSHELSSKFVARKEGILWAILSWGLGNQKTPWIIFQWQKN